MRPLRKAVPSTTGHQQQPLLAKIEAGQRQLSTRIRQTRALLERVESNPGARSLRKLREAEAAMQALDEDVEALRRGDRIAPSVAEENELVRRRYEEMTDRLKLISREIYHGH